MNRLVPAAAVPLLLTAAIGVSGCGSGDASSSRSDATVTRTVTEPPPPSPSASEPSKPPASEPPSPRTPSPRTSSESAPRAPSPVSDAASVVRSYVAAINARDYARAWDLGGRNLSGSYAQFVAGFAGTAHDTVRILGSDRTSASVRLEATQTDGSLKVFEGTYTVRDGTIVGADLHEVAGPDPSTDGGYRYFKNCAAAWDAGAAPIEKGEPGYAPHLDRDNDGVACEPYDDASP